MAAETILSRIIRILETGTGEDGRVVDTIFCPRTLGFFLADLDEGDFDYFVKSVMESKGIKVLALPVLENQELPEHMRQFFGRDGGRFIQCISRGNAPEIVFIPSEFFRKQWGSGNIFKRNVAVICP